MKFFVLILVVATVVLANEVERKFIETLQECAKENSVSEDVFNNWDQKGLPADENVKCAIKCTVDKLKYVNADKKFEIPEKDKALLPKESPLWPALEKCNDMVLGDCDSAFKFGQCLENHIKELIS